MTEDNAQEAECLSRLTAELDTEIAMKTIRDDWTNGLSTMFANALKGHGFKSKQDVIDAFDKGLIYIKPNGGGCTVYSLGRIGITEVRLWLGIDVSPNKTKNIEKAINLLEANGYTVTRNA